MTTELEHLLLSSHKDEMISFMEAHPEVFDQAIKLAISDKKPCSWRAAWLLWSCIEENDPRVQGYVKDIIDTIKTKNHNHQRELMKILQQMELNEEYQGYLLDVCVTIWKKIDNKPSVRFNAFKMIMKIAQKHPDLTNEVVLLTQNQYMDYLSSSAQKSISKMVKDLKQY